MPSTTHDREWFIYSTYLWWFGDSLLLCYPQYHINGDESLNVGLYIQYPAIILVWRGPIWFPSENGYHHLYGNGETIIPISARLQWLCMCPTLKLSPQRSTLGSRNLSPLLWKKWRLKYCFAGHVGHGQRTATQFLKNNWNLRTQVGSWRFSSWKIMVCEALELEYKDPLELSAFQMTFLWIERRNKRT